MSRLTEWHLIRAFHLEFGLPPHAYHLRLRLAVASELLSHGFSVSTVAYECGNAGSIPHALEVEGAGIEQQTGVIQPGDSAILTLTLRPGNYEVYCPVGEDSHKKLGMETHLKVVSASRSGYSQSREIKMNQAATTPRTAVQAIRVIGGGPVIQILPGPFPFADSAAPILKQFGNEREGLESQAQNGPCSNNVAPIAGTFTLSAWAMTLWRRDWR